MTAHTYPALTLYAPAPASVRLIECSPPSWMVALALEEKRLPYRVEHLSFAAGEHKSPAMLARNPRGTIPVLTDGDLAVHETFAILSYLEYAYPLVPLLPSGQARARALTRFHESDQLKARGMQLFAYLMRTPDDQRDPVQVDEMRAALQAELELWERYYGEAEWAAGEALSLADLAVFTYLATAVRLALVEAARLPRLLAFHDRMRTRASVVATWPPTW
ncbi:glutathione S-transferase family protein [Haliangium sp.]|uniref:glutathione S-transferase family protein n=1 Tax=Haliangium sp. TaxID=2663208 RepID=UPI003D10B7F5